LIEECRRHLAKGTGKPAPMDGNLSMLVVAADQSGASAGVLSGRATIIRGFRWRSVGIIIE